MVDPLFAELGDDDVSELYRILCHYLKRPPVCCYVTPLDERGLCICGKCPAGDTKHGRPDRPLLAPPSRFDDLPLAAQLREHRARFGVHAGKSGLVVIDVDVKKGKTGIKTLALASETLGALPPTLVQRTPSGGLHYFFRVPAVREGQAKSKGSNVFNAAAKLPLGADGGIDVVVGANHAFGGAGYEVISLAPGDLPELPLAWFDVIPNIGGREEGLAEGEGWAAWDTFPDTDKGRTAKAWCIEQFTTFCQTAPEGGAGIRDEKIKALVFEARSMGLPPDVSIPIAFEHWNSRCAPPAQDPYGKDFGDKFERAWHSVSTRDVGGLVTYELYVFGQDAHSGRLKFTAEEQYEIVAAERLGERMAKAAPRKGKRMLPNPEHEYSFTRIGSGLGKLPSITDYDLCIELSRHPLWQGVIQWDLFREMIYAVNPPRKLGLEEGKDARVDLLNIRHWVNAVLSKDAQPDTIRDVLLVMAHDNEYHPIKEYLETLDETHGEMPAGEALQYLLGVCKKMLHILPEIERMSVVRQLVASVARVYKPGCDVHTCVVLTGVEAAGKSGLLKVLYGDYYDTLDGDLTNKDLLFKLKGSWGLEMGEMSATKKTSRESLLQFLSQATDKFRAPYDRKVESHRRQCVFWASTNELELFEDMRNGARRFEPVTITDKVDLSKLQRARDAIWRAAHALYKINFKYHLSAEEHEVAAEHKEQNYSKSYETDRWIIAEARILLAQGDPVTTSAIWKAMNRGEVIGKMHERDAMPIGKALLRAKWRKVRERSANFQGFYYLPPEGPYPKMPKD